MNVIVWLKIPGRKKYANWVPGPVSAYKMKPDTLDNELAVKINLEIPDEVFEEPVYEAKLVLPKVTRKFPELTEVLKNTQDALTKKMGFKVRLEVPQLKVENTET